LICILFSDTHCTNRNDSVLLDVSQTSVEGHKFGLKWFKRLISFGEQSFRNQNPLWPIRDPVFYFSFVSTLVLLSKISSTTRAPMELMKSTYWCGAASQTESPVQLFNLFPQDIRPWIPHIERAIYIATESILSSGQEERESAQIVQIGNPSPRKTMSCPQEPPTTRYPIPSPRYRKVDLDLSSRLHQWNRGLADFEPEVGASEERHYSSEAMISGCEVASFLDWSRIHVIGQLDKKFILASVGSKLLAFDQHAVHERIRLEELMLDSFNTTTGFSSVNKKIAVNRKRVQSAALSRPEGYFLTSEQKDHISAASPLLSKLGWKIDWKPTGVQVVAVPLVCGVQLDSAASVIMTTAKELEGSGYSMMVPSAFRDVLASKACRGAIMFGQELSSDECRMMLRQLSNCSNPFECAHGRPSVCLLKDLA
jgi:DNA mismatch repair ATPase MutL